jgi:Flp pilus assembly pilin Flp
MDFLRKGYVKLTEWNRGQSMTEYALILAAIAVVCIVGYNLIGTNVSTVLGKVNSNL